MYPYPSGPAHQGHVRNYTFGDLLVRHRTMQGYAVLSPFGFDSFGLPAENAAIQTGEHPRIFTEARIAELKASVSASGAVYDWRREIRSHDPAYIRWNQVIFLRLLEAGLAYRAMAPVNWCPGCQTVLANEQVLADGTCERSGDLVDPARARAVVLPHHRLRRRAARRPRRPRWPERVKTMQRNWIGRPRAPSSTCRSSGSEGDGLALRVFTTRPDTSFGMTYAVVAPEHPLVDVLTTDDAASRGRRPPGSAPRQDRPRAHVRRGRGALAKRGAFTGGHVRQPVHRRADPRLRGRLRPHALRHRRHHGGPGRGRAGLGLRPGPRPPDRAHRRSRPTGFDGGAWTGDGRQDQQRFLDGLGRRRPPRSAPSTWLEERGIGRAHGQLPPAGLAGLPPALLGMPDPRRLLPRRTGSSRCPRTSCRSSPPTTSSSSRPASRP